MHARKWTFPERQMNLRLGSDLAFAGLQLSVVRSVAADTRPDLLFLAIIGLWTDKALSAVPWFLVESRDPQND